MYREKEKRANFPREIRKKNAVKFLKRIVKLPDLNFYYQKFRKNCIELKGFKCNFIKVLKTLFRAYSFIGTVKPLRTDYCSPSWTRTFSICIRDRWIKMICLFKFYFDTLDQETNLSDFM